LERIKNDTKPLQNARARAEKRAKMYLEELEKLHTGCSSLNCGSEKSGEGEQNAERA
jgi:hypothetical protein